MTSLFARLRQLLRQPTLQVARKVVIAVVGGTVVLVGIAMVVLPGPAFLVIPLGLAILGTEFIWAKRWLERAKGLLPKRTQKPTPHMSKDATKHASQTDRPTRVSP